MDHLANRILFKGTFQEYMLLPQMTWCHFVGKSRKHLISIPFRYSVTGYCISLYGWTLKNKVRFALPVYILIHFMSMVSFYTP